MECSRTFKFLMSFQDHTKYFINIEDGVSRLSSVFLILVVFKRSHQLVDNYNTVTNGMI